jgi:hypothetical protein
MDGQTSVRVLDDAVVFFSREMLRVDVNGDVRKVRQVV